MFLQVLFLPFLSIHSGQESPSPETAPTIYIGFEVSLNSVKESTNRKFEDVSDCGGLLELELKRYVFHLGHSKTGFQTGTHTQFSMDLERFYLTGLWKWNSWFWVGAGPGYIKIQRDQKSEFPGSTFFTKDEQLLFTTFEVRFQPLKNVHFLLTADLIDQDTNLFQAGMGFRFGIKKP